MNNQTTQFKTDLNDLRIAKLRDRQLRLALSGRMAESAKVAERVKRMRQAMSVDMHELYMA